MDDNTIDLRGPTSEPAEMTPVEFEPDRVQATIVVAVKVGGRKVQEIPLTVAFCYPFDLHSLLTRACEQARRQWEHQQDA